MVNQGDIKFSFLAAANTKGFAFGNIKYSIFRIKLDQSFLNFKKFPIGKKRNVNYLFFFTFSEAF